METELEAIWDATVGNQLIPKWSSFSSITTDRYEKTVFRKRQLDICYGVNLDVYPIPGISPRIYASRIPRTFPVSGSHTPGSRHRKVSPRQVSPHPFPLPLPWQSHTAICPLRHTFSQLYGHHARLVPGIFTILWTESKSMASKGELVAGWYIIFNHYIFQTRPFQNI